MLHALKPVRTAAPETTPVSTADAKAQPSVGSSADGELVGALIAAATSELDGWSGYLGRCLVTQTWRFDFPEFPADGVLRLAMGDLQSVVVTYVDEDGQTQTLSNALYRTVTDALGPAVVLNEGEAWPETDDRPAAVSVAAVLGYGAASAVPAAIKQAILLRVGQLYGFATREADLKKSVVEGVGSREWDVAGQATIAADRAISSLLAGFRLVRV